MKTSDGLQSLREEYNKYDVGENVIDNYEEFDFYLYRVIRGVDRQLEKAFNQIQENEKWKRRAKIKNKLPFLFPKENLEEFDYDNMLLIEISNLAIYNLDFFHTIRDLSNEDNCQELNRLTNFLLDWFEKHYEYLELKRKTVDGNIEIDENKYDYDLELINDFANAELSKFEKQKQYSRS